MSSVGYIVTEPQQHVTKAPASHPLGLVSIHTVFVAIAVGIYNWTAVSEKSGQSAFLTLAAICQCSAIALLVAGTFSARSVEGISAQALKLQAVALSCRLSSTTWLLGYIPFDATGNMLYQCFDIASLLMVLCLLRRVLKAQHETGEGMDDDNLPVAPFLVICFILAVSFHADLDENPLFDTLWMCGLFIGAIALLPQLWLISRNSKQIPTVLNHFVAAVTMSCMASGYFFWLAFADFTSESYFTEWIGMVLSGQAVLAAHVVQFMLAGHFVYVQLRRLASRPKSWPFLQTEVQM